MRAGKGNRILLQTFGKVQGRAKEVADQRTRSEKEMGEKKS